MSKRAHTVNTLVDLICWSTESLKTIFRLVDAKRLVQNSWISGSDEILHPDPVALALADLARSVQGVSVTFVTPTQFDAHSLLLSALESPDIRNAKAHLAILVAEVAHSYAVSRLHRAEAATAYALLFLESHPLLSQVRSGLIRARAYHAHALLRPSWASKTPSLEAVQQLERAREFGFSEAPDQATYERVEASFELVRRNTRPAIRQLGVWFGRHSKLPLMHQAVAAHQQAQYLLLEGDGARADVACRFTREKIWPHRIRLPTFEYEVIRAGVAAHILRHFGSRVIDHDETLTFSGPASFEYRHACALMQLASNSPESNWRYTCLRKAVDLYQKADRPLEAFAAFVQLPRQFIAFDPIGIELSRVAGDELQDFLRSRTEILAQRYAANDDDDTNEVH